MKVSIIIATKNEGKNIGRLLTSLAEQTFKDFKIIVVDNYSTDKTRQIAQKFTDQVYQVGPERSAQRNFGLKKARGQYVLFLDADMTLEPKVLAECLKALEGNRMLAAVTIDEISKGAGFFAKVKSLEKRLITGETYLEAPRFFRKKDLEKLGGYDENLISAEDWDLAQRIQKLGKFSKISSKIYHHGPTSVLVDIKKKFYYAKHIQKYASKHPDAFQKQKSILFRLAILFQKPKIILAHPLEFGTLLLLKFTHYSLYLSFRLAQMRAIASAVKSNFMMLIRQSKQKGTRHVIKISLPSLIIYVAKHFYYQFFLGARTFTFNHQKYHYFYGLYNFTYVAERSVEIPIIWAYVKKHQPDKILEVGNVLSHYFPISHDVVDKYEKTLKVINEDIITFNPNRRYDLIVSISTIEHVGWDEKRKSKHKIILAIAKIRNLLEKGGQTILTLPIGYNHYLDELIKSSRKKLFTNIFFLKRVSADNRWKQVPYQEVANTKFNTPYPFANALAIGIIKNDKLS